MNVIGIGTDLTEISRIEKMIENHGDHFLKRVYSEKELEYSESRRQLGEHLAARWAAKEAVMKAFGTGWVTGIRWRDIEVRNDESGKPTVVLYGGARELADRLGVKGSMISISHTADLAVAFVILFGNESSDSTTLPSQPLTHF